MKSSAWLLVRGGLEHRERKSLDSTRKTTCVFYIFVMEGFLEILISLLLFYFPFLISESNFFLLATEKKD